MEHLGPTLLIMALIAFGIYRRLKRTIGFQKLNRKRLIFRTTIFGVLGCVFLYAGLLHPIHFIADAVGLAVGLILSYYAIKHIQFEKRDDAWYYRTHLWVEVTLIVLLLGRIVYRLLAMYYLKSDSGMTGAAAAPTLESYTKDPLTVGIFFVLISFYIRYFTYLLRKQRELVAPESHLTS
ncbi:CcdC protein domain-containing protein [Paenibacillus sp. FSL H7-0331]|uniref:CcdC protein domain-containing protein n=1 Tax=Paenibacillus sp. FSL H7-0331 TaxID=1920421 RepID=UPI00096C0BFF|nr:CcdC protein domain-containing protein [Paenibacillus sp. FSL H7-0331]OMF05026.1 hypothetical protein BK127_32750 [Paenibacillus sp. FSL H7-0331]